MFNIYIYIWKSWRSIYDNEAYVGVADTKADQMQSKPMKLFRNSLHRYAYECSNVSFMQHHVTMKISMN